MNPIEEKRKRQIFIANKQKDVKLLKKLKYNKI
jgi:hypothetical protein